MKRCDVIAICVMVVIAVLLVASVNSAFIHSELCEEKGGVFISGRCFNKGESK